MRLRAVSELVGHASPGPTLARERRDLTAFFDRFLKGRASPWTTIRVCGAADLLS